MVRFARRGTFSANMIRKRVRGWTSGRSLPVQRFFVYPRALSIHRESTISHLSLLHTDNIPRGSYSDCIYKGWGGCALANVNNNTFCGFYDIVNDD